MKNLTAKGEKILEDLAQSEETQRLIARTKEMCGTIWDQLQEDIGLNDSKIEDFLESGIAHELQQCSRAAGQEIWDKIDGDVLRAAVGTLLKSLLELVLEFVPSLELPRVNGFYSSPVGEVCYQIAGMLTSCTVCSRAAGMQFSTFSFSPDGVQIDIDKKLTVQLDDISAEVNDFCWQFAKSSWPFVTGEGGASVKVSQASVHLEYTLEYSEGKVAIVIEKQAITMRDFKVSVCAHEVFTCVLTRCSDDVFAEAIKRIAISNRMSFDVVCFCVLCPQCVCCAVLCCLTARAGPADVPQVRVAGWLCM